MLGFRVTLKKGIVLGFRVMLGSGQTIHTYILCPMCPLSEHNQYSHPSIRGRPMLGFSQSGCSSDVNDISLNYCSYYIFIQCPDPMKS